MSAPPDAGVYYVRCLDLLRTCTNLPSPTCTLVAQSLSMLLENWASSRGGDEPLHAENITLMTCHYHNVSRWRMILVDTQGGRLKGGNPTTIICGYVVTSREEAAENFAVAVEDLTGKHFPLVPLPIQQSPFTIQQNN